MPRTLRLPCLLALLLTLAGHAAAQQIIILPDRPGPTPQEGAGLRVTSHEVDVDIEDQLATTRIVQVIENPSSRQVQATLLLPVPAGAHVRKFTMDVGGKDTEAELLDADKARDIYERIVRQTRDPALLEYCGQALLRARIFPIEPNSSKRVTLTYTHLLPRDGSMIQYDYPMVGRTLDSGHVSKLAMTIRVRTDEPLTTLYCPTHEVDITRDGSRRATVGLETDASSDRDLKLLFASRPTDGKPAALELLTYQPSFGDPGFFLLLASPDHAVERGAALPKDLVFVLDTSGSMKGDKLAQAKRAMQFCLDSLNASDRFQLIRFSTEAESLFDGLQPADAQNRAEAKAFVNNLQARGGTAIAEALVAAHETFGSADSGDRPRMVVFLTDGQPTIGERDNDAIIALLGEPASLPRIFCFGVGTDINTHLLDRVAEKSRAVTTYVLPDEDLEIKLSSFYDKIDTPVMTKLRLLTDSFASVTQVHPKELPDLFAGQQLVVVGRYTRLDDQGQLQLLGSVGDGAVQLQTSLPEARDDNAFVARLWAMRRVGYLLDEIRLQGETEELKDEVTRLAREYAIVTPYTSHLILEDEARRGLAAARQSLRVESEADRLEVRQRAAQAYTEMRDVQVGEGSVAGAITNQALKEAKADDQVARANAWAMLGRPAAAPALGQTTGSHELAKPTRFVGGRAFIQNGRQWVDTRVHALPESTKVNKVAFGSDAYFALLRRSASVAQWLSVGPNLQLVLDGEIYEIVEGE